MRCVNLMHSHHLLKGGIKKTTTPPVPPPAHFGKGKELLCIGGERPLPTNKLRKETATPCRVIDVEPSPCLHGVYKVRRAPCCLLRVPVAVRFETALYYIPGLSPAPVRPNRVNQDVGVTACRVGR